MAKVCSALRSSYLSSLITHRLMRIAIKLSQKLSPFLTLRVMAGSLAVKYGESLRTWGWRYQLKRWQTSLPRSTHKATEESPFKTSVGH